MCQIAAVAPPVAQAGTNQAVSAGRTVTLDGSPSTNPSGLGTLTCSWSFAVRPPGSGTSLFYTQSASPTFVADVVGTYTIQLAVSNGLTTSTTSVSVTAF